MLTEGAFKLALVSAIGLVAGLPVSFSMKGGTSFNSPSATKSKVSLGPRWVIGKGNGTSLSFKYGSGAGGGLKEGQKVSFSQSGMRFGDYELKVGDVLCSPNEDGNYLVMKEEKGSNGTKFRVDGYNGIVTRCDRSLLNSSVKTVKIEGIKRAGDVGRSSASTIYIGSCSFTLNSSGGASGQRRTIAWNDCKGKKLEGVRSVGDATLGADYETD